MSRTALIVGFGVSGRSAAEFLIGQSWSVVAVDINASEICKQPDVQRFVERGVPLLHPEELISLDPFRLAILSPGVSSETSLVKELAAKGIECIGEAELAFRFMKQQAVGITGTNGKTTVTLLVEHVLNRSGKKALALGNVGIPLASQIPELPENSLVVAELSSFQLETMQRKVLSDALILNITPDHLDRYRDFEHYARAKAAIGHLLKPNGLLFLNDSCYQPFSALFQGMPVQRFGYGKELDAGTDLQALYRRGEEIGLLPQALQGRKSHDLENFLAAYLLCERQGVHYRAFCDAWSSFVKPRHRLEFVKEVNGVAFYDDSKGTNVDAVVRAVEAMDRPTLLIAGGVHKGSSYTSWLPHFEGKVKGIYAIGEAARQIEEELGKEIPVMRCLCLKDAVEKSFKQAGKGEAVLLSPGCSSFDMFRDYAERGEEFVKWVNSL